MPVEALTPAARIVEVSVGGRLVDSRHEVKLKPGVGKFNSATPESIWPRRNVFATRSSWRA